MKLFMFSKIKTNIYIPFVLMVLGVSSCTQINYDPLLESKLMGDSLNATYTISQLIDSFSNDSDEYTYLKYGVSKTSGLFTCNPISTSEDVVIKGVVTSSDEAGNVYKYLVVQEDGTDGRAIKIAIDASGLSGLYPLGQRVWIRCNNLYLGSYAQSYQIGTLYYNTEKTIEKTTVVTDTNNNPIDTTYTTIYRTEPGKIALPIAKACIFAYGMPDASLAKADTMTIAEIKAAGRTVVNKLVCIKNAYFTGNGANSNVPVSITAAEQIFAPSTNGVGYPQSREIQDGTGSIFVSTSEYSKFADTKIPDSSNRGNITAIVGWYNDKKPAINPTVSTTEIYYQLTLRSLDDLGKGFESFHAEVDN